MGTNIIEREKWGAKPPCGKVGFLKTPVPYVVMVWSDQSACETRDACGARVQELQQTHITTLRLPDIQFNFVVGGDGNVYAGRGWERAPTPFPKSVKDADKFNGKTIQIGVIELKYRKPLVNSLEAFSNIVSKGVVKNHLTMDFKMYILKDDKLVFVERPDSQLTSSKLSLF